MYNIHPFKEIIKLKSIQSNNNSKFSLYIFLYKPKIFDALCEGKMDSRILFHGIEKKNLELDRLSKFWT